MEEAAAAAWKLRREKRENNPVWAHQRPTGQKKNPVIEWGQRVWAEPEAGFSVARQCAGSLVKGQDLHHEQVWGKEPGK